MTKEHALIIAVILGSCLLPTSSRRRLAGKATVIGAILLAVKHTKVCKSLEMRADSAFKPFGRVSL